MKAMKFVTVMRVQLFNNESLLYLSILSNI